MNFKQQTKYDNNVASSTTVPFDAFANDVQVGDVVVGWLGWDLSGSPNITQIVDNLGNVYVPEVRVNDGTDNQAHQMFRGVIAIPGSGCIITATLSPTATSRLGQAAIFGELVDSTPDASSAQFQNPAGTGTDAVSSGTANTNAPADLIYGGSQKTSTDSGTIVAGTGFTQLNGIGIANGLHEYKRGGAAGASEAATFTHSDAAGFRCTGMIAFKCAAKKPDYTLFPIQKIADAYTSNSTRTLQ